MIRAHAQQQQQQGWVIAADDGGKWEGKKRRKRNVSHNHNSMWKLGVVSRLFSSTIAYSMTPGTRIPDIIQIVGGDGRPGPFRSVTGIETSSQPVMSQQFDMDVWVIVRMNDRRKAGREGREE
jgi:hypothetical protein